jgi:hypothetical protein
MAVHPFRPAPAYRQELEILRRQALDSWEAVADLSLRTIREISGRSPGSEARLIRLRGQARLVVEIGLEPAEAALLLHAGVVDRRGLAEADAHSLHRQVGRLQRGLTGVAMAPIPLVTVRAWILQAAAAPGRSWN